MPSKTTPALLLAATLAAAPLAAHAQSEATATPTTESSPSGDYWRLVASPYTAHFHGDSENIHKPVYMLGLERQRSDGWVWGGIYFSNSFGQPSGYVYLGERINNFSPWNQLFAQWTVGVLYGYVYPYEDKVPFNYHGFSPGATLSLGWQFTRQFSMQMDLLGAAGMMFQLSIDFR